MADSNPSPFESARDCRRPCRALAPLLGYGIKTTYEMAAFTNAAMIRHTDFNATSS